MRLVRIDGSHMKDKQSAHEYMQSELNIVGYHGHNLDALFDALTSYDKSLSIMLINKPELMNQLGTYGEKVIQTFIDSVSMNNNIEFKVI